MKTLFFVLCLFLSVEGALSQETGKLYTTLSDLLNETSSSTLNVIKEKRNKKQLFMSGGGDFKIYNGDKELDKEIKKKTFAIEIDDTLYINCIGLKFKKRPIGAWFAPGLICKGKVYFTAHLCMRVAGDYDAVREYHRALGCICYENHEMGLYFINDPDDYWIEILPAK